MFSRSKSQSLLTIIVSLQIFLCVPKPNAVTTGVLAVVVGAGLNRIRGCGLTIEKPAPVDTSATSFSLTYVAHDIARTSHFLGLPPRQRQEFKKGVCYWEALREK